MIALNFTLLVEVGLFLVFLWATNRIVLRPLLRTMDARTAQIEGDRASAETDARAAQQLETQYMARLTGAHQGAAQRLHQARYDAYQENRTALEELRSRAETDVAAFRDSMEAHVAAERERFPDLLAGIIQAADQQVNAERTLL
jgi:F0F1-type ATP synthase membrane subunit b/b'